MATTFRKQDMPPSGGYKSIPFERIPARKYFSGYTMILGFVGVTSVSMYLFYKNHLQIQKRNVEMRSAHMALAPMLVAERDRTYLKQLRRNRDEEAELMKNVPGWEVGTYYGEPIYKTLPPDTLLEKCPAEHYAHTNYYEFHKRQHFHLFT